jgi:signal peptidase II
MLKVKKQKNQLGNNGLFGLIAVLFLLVLDQIIKYLAATKNIFFDFKIFDLVFVKNTGAIWGSFQDGNTIFIWLSLIAIGILMFSYNSVPKKACFFLWLLFGGIISNLIDRLFRGFVVDFIDFRFWPVFNIADAMIIIGIIGLIFFIWKDDNSKKIKKN